MRICFRVVKYVLAAGMRIDLYGIPQKRELIFLKRSKMNSITKTGSRSRAAACFCLLILATRKRVGEVFDAALFQICVSTKYH